MPTVTKVKSGSRYEDLVSYSRVVAVGDLIFVSNTAGIDYTTREISDDAGEQCEKALRNIERALASVGATLADVVKLVRHVPNRADNEKVREVIGRVFKGIDPAATHVATPLASDIYKVELEVIAYRGVGTAQQERLRISV
jgi:enamine deaminase RidA (YjgF/YER057c/UK114 family)